MTDIVERLRKGVDNDGYHHLIDAADKIMHEAADEIERLRAGLKIIVDADGWWDAPSLARDLLAGKAVP